MEFRPLLIPVHRVTLDRMLHGLCAVTQFSSSVVIFFVNSPFLLVLLAL